MRDYDYIETIELVVPNGKGKERIDSYLTHFVRNASRNKIQILIKRGLIEVNGEKVKANFKVESEDKIVVNIPRPEPIDVVAENIPIDFIYQDKDLAVINKQAGLIVHPTYSIGSGTLVNALMYHFGDELSSMNGSLRPGIVHRLDKDTTGLMVVAKSDIVHKPLADQFADKTAGREYIGICIGRFKEKKGRIETLLTRWKRDRRIIVTSEFEGKRAVTNYEVLEEFNRFTLLKFKLETGRTHQIRAHMKHLKRPLFGDPMYGGQNIAGIDLPRNQIKRLKYMLEVMPRQALHGKHLEFFHPVLKKRMRFTAETPDDMKQVLDMIREYDY